MTAPAYDEGMGPVVIVVVVLFVLLAMGLAVVALRRAPEAPPVVVAPPDEDAAERRARFDALDEHGTELLQRRVELDDRRGTLGGNEQIYAEFEELEARLRAGEISEDEFEQGKVRLLSGG
jgi:uncharacterized membrane protein